MKTIVTKASEADIPMIAAVEADSFSDPWTADSLLSSLSDRLGIFLAAKNESGALTGYLIGSCDGYSGYIEKVAVCGAARRQGTGTALLRAFCESLPETADNISLEVRESNDPAIRLYERFGFEKAGVRKKFYSCPVENGIVMIMKLKEE